MPKPTTRKTAYKKSEVRCPTCGGQQFLVQPRAISVLAYDFRQPGKVAVNLDDYCRDESDQVTCANCEWEGRWSDLGIDVR
jgi:ssDNA-binding Zn-finger/Zn-ribbon topoisomerase 1